jgi:DivIVA domain-containing protein
MTMMWLFAVLVVLVMGGVAMVAAGRGKPMAASYDDSPDALVPAAGDLTGTDLRRVRFPLAFRGYRMADVDALLDRLAAQLEEPVETPETDDDAGQDHPEAGESRGDSHNA